MQNLNGLICLESSAGGALGEGGSTLDSTANFSSNGAPLVDKNARSDDTDVPSHRNPSISNSNGAPPSNSEVGSQRGASETESRRFAPVPVTPDGASVSIHSGGAVSEGTNNYANVSVNELFSSSSLLRMNAVIPETESLSQAEWAGEEGGGAEGEGDGKDERRPSGDSFSHLSVPMEGGSEVTSRSGQGNISYQEMVSALSLFFFKDQSL